MPYNYCNTCGIHVFIYSNPSGSSMYQAWPQYNNVSKEYMNFDSTTSIRENLYEDRLNLWNEEIPKLLAIGNKPDFNSSEIVLPTRMGKIKGINKTVDNQQVFQFRGIPFAAPPVGALRFRKPEPSANWTGTLDATIFGPACLQMVPVQFLTALPNPEMSEDCLHLNIFIPRSVDKSKPRSVMIWIHGGGYVIGMSSVFESSFLALHGDVIVVTINYRLGYFGFLSTGDSASKGNYGLWDQHLAIQWVKGNIADYGGDPTSVTLFGESSGGSSVSLQALYPGNKDLFQRAIAQSGVAFSPWAVSHDPLPSALDLARRTGCSVDGNPANMTEVVECIRWKDANEINLSITLPSDVNPATTDLTMTMPVAPVVDGEFLSNTPEKLLENVNSESYAVYSGIDFMAGTVNNEGSVAVSFLMPYEKMFDFNTTEGIPPRVMCDNVVSSLVRDFFNNSRAVSDVLCLKYGVRGDVTNLGPQSQKLVDLYSDAMVIAPAIQQLLVHTLAAGNQTTYQYMYSYKSPFSLNPAQPPDWMKGTNHGDEINILFPGLVQTMYAGYIPTGDDAMTSTMMARYWSNFAKSGYVLLNMHFEGLTQYTWIICPLQEC
jgi:carboxylesterase type B